MHGKKQTNKQKNRENWSLILSIYLIDKAFFFVNITALNYTILILNKKYEDADVPNYVFVFFIDIESNNSTFMRNNRFEKIWAILFIVY